MEGKVCTKCKQWKPLEEYCKKKEGKYGRNSQCKECKKEYNKQHYQNNKEHYKEYRENNKEHYKEQRKQHYQNNKEHIKEQHKQWRENNPEYHKQYYQNNKDHIKEQSKQWEENNKEHKKEYNKQRYQNNKEQYKEQHKQYYQNNKEHIKVQSKEYRENNKEHRKEQRKEYKENNKQNNLQYISSIVEQINPVFKQLNLPVYGYVYMFENTKSKHKYLGQTIRPLKERYSFEGRIIKSWIKERLKKSNQKFKKELIEEDIVVTEVLDVAFCQYHLDKLEAYYIDKYDSYNNGYNNNAGYWNRDDGIEEFNQILKENNLQFINGQLLKMEA